MIEKLEKWGKGLGESLLGPMVAILFWFMMIVIAVLAIGRGKLFETNIFEAFGAVGQVIFAAAVFWLGWQQFQFTKLVSDRQHRADLYPHRLSLTNRVKEALDILNNPTTITTATIDTLYGLHREIEHLFADEASTMFYELVEWMDQLVPDAVWLRQALIVSQGGEEFNTRNARFTSEIDKLTDYHIEVLDELEWGMNVGT